MATVKTSELDVEKMTDKNKTKAQLIRELAAMRRNMADLHQRSSTIEALTIANNQKTMTTENQPPGLPSEQPLAEILYQTGIVLNSSLNYDQVLDNILEQVKQVVAHDAASVMLIEGGQAHLSRWRGYAKFDPETVVVPGSYRIADTPTLRTILKTGQALVISNVAEYGGWLETSSQAWIRSYIGVPLSIRNQVVGFLNLNSARPGFFTRPDAERVQAFADQAAIVLQNAQLYNQARQEVIKRVKALKKERNLVTAILDTAGALVVMLNTQGRILRFNRACEQITGYTFNEVKGKQIWDLFTIPEDVEAVKANFEKLKAGQVPDEYEGYWLTKDGDRRVIVWSSTILTDNKRDAEYIIHTGLDITQRKQAEEQLRRSEERYALVALSANDGLWDWDLKSDEIYFSPRWKAMLGYGEDEISNRPDEWSSRVHPDDLGQLEKDIATQISGEPSQFKNEHRILHRNGSYRWVRSQGLAVRDEDWQPNRIAGSQTDITQQKMAEAKLIHNAFHDALTGLPNRNLFMTHLERAIEQSKEDDNFQFAVLFIDLDRFKVVNDSLGHMVGDQLLVAVAGRLKACLRQTDMVARFGGDEFAILLDGIKNSNEATHVADRIQNRLAQPVLLQEHEIFTAASIGIALSTTGYEWPEDILRDADTTMYQAKAQGQARHVTFNASLRSKTVAAWQLEAELRQAIERDEFRLYYQPIVSATNGQIKAVEALLRWQHPERGLVSPGEFIPLAEETGLIIPMSDWILRTACAQTKAWHKAGYASLQVAVNVSPRQLHYGNGGATLLEGVQQTLEETGLAAQFLELEISENITTINTNLNLQSLNELSALGVRISVDDFGIASSLSFLRDFPVNTLKIDRSFVKDVTKKANDAAIMRAIITMAHSLNLKVVAEGVESEEQLTFLRAQKCDEIQGYYFSRPVPAVALTKLLEAGTLGD